LYKRWVKLQEDHDSIEETSEVLQGRIVLLENSVDVMKQEIVSKTEQLTKLTHSVKEMRRVSQPGITVNAVIHQLTDELENLRLGSAAHQTHNAFLAQTVHYHHGRTEIAD
jgi:SMC interacting uncharacterized protein involved in chromosome segregation